MAITKFYRVYNTRESLTPSYEYDFSDEYDGIRRIKVLNSDVTGTNEYSIVRITRNTARECDEEMEGQITDGIFENSIVGDVTEIVDYDE